MVLAGGTSAGRVDPSGFPAEEFVWRRAAGEPARRLQRLSWGGSIAGGAVALGERRPVRRRDWATSGAKQGLVRECSDDARRAGRAIW